MLCACRPDGVAALDAERSAVEASGRDRLVDSEDGRQRLVRGSHTGGPTLRGIERVAEHPGYGLRVVRDLVGEQRLVVTIGAGVAFAGNVGAR